MTDAQRLAARSGLLRSHVGTVSVKIRVRSYLSIEWENCSNTMTITPLRVLNILRVSVVSASHKKHPDLQVRRSPWRRSKTEMSKTEFKNGLFEIPDAG